METGAAWAGLDLGEILTTVCVVDDAGKVLHEQACRSEVADLDASLSAYSGTLRLIGAEAGVGTHLVRKLRERGYPIALFETRKTKQFLTIRKNKTDAGDARGIADL